MTGDWAKAAVADHFVFQTTRLVIRPLRPQDQQLYLALYSSPQVMAFIGPTLGVDKAKHSFQIALQLNTKVPFKRLFLAVCQNDQPIGLCAVNQWSAHSATAEVGLMLLPDWQRQGYASEALLALQQGLQQLFNTVQIWADMNPNNKAVIRLFTTAGYSADPTQPGRYWLKPI
ncbi:GNAT family N-acetyltransferase [Rheinheimera faecalis]